ncbi:uncharacterized protein SAPINGB_P005144 [Magnusiomyces paraingens]|uniref:Cullin family profile domain-containing protein n=1 Tax=Magnusiomyces paraingens TaxID=2606893 RepID=A0A5E8C5R4_9ASCO|nr:uncharacterized protein SAPINGB_P005144 [Saprochaete ingens]VVT56546.1 unnamed protein product [Saprochaete ingens]
MTQGLPFPAANDIDETWNFIKYGVDKILIQDINQGIEPSLYMNVYTAIHNFCVQPNSSHTNAGTVSRGAALIGADIYNHLAEYLTAHLTETLNNSTIYNDENLVDYYIRKWDRYVIGSRYLNNIFSYLNRHWVKREREEGHRHIHDINTLCLIRWKEDLFNPIHSRLIGAVLDLINKQRDGETVPTQHIRAVVQSCVALGLDENNTKKTNLTVYRSFFEAQFIESTAAYYSKESSEFLQTMGVVEYLKKASDRLREESGRITMYLRPESEEILRSTCVQVLVSSHSEEIQEQFFPLLKGDRESDLKLMFYLLESVPGGLIPLQKNLFSYVKEQGLAAVDALVAGSKEAPASSIDTQAYIDTLQRIHSKYTNLVQAAFNSHSDMQKSLDDACRYYINNNSVTNKPAKGRAIKTPDLLARYCDTLLRKSSKNADGASNDAYLDGAMTIFQYVDEKDAFEKAYSRTLARRLVHGTSLSQDAETNMITKLKGICGSDYTNKLQRMFQDMSVSTEMHDQFKEYLDNADVKPVGDFTPYVLAESFWPLPPFNSQFNLPPELTVIKDKFTSYYNGKHTGRKLQWLWNFSKGELKANISKSSKVGFTLMVSMVQMAILLPFNDALEYTIEQLKDITLLDDDFLKGSLTILLKARILFMSGGNGSSSGSGKPSSADGDAMDVDEAGSASKKKTSGATIDEALVAAPGTKYRLNTDFKSKKMRINLNLPLKNDQKKEAEDTQKSLVDDRRMFLDACIVRIMKARQELSHVHLIQETIDQSSKRFVPSVTDIKKCIESLIEREYLQRVDEKTYRYLA